MKKLPKPTNKFTFNTVFQHYKDIIQSDYFNPATAPENNNLTILRNSKVSRVAGLGSLSDRFVKNGAKVLDKPITDLCSLSISSE